MKFTYECLITLITLLPPPTQHHSFSRNFHPLFISSLKSTSDEDFGQKLFLHLVFCRNIRYLDLRILDNKLFKTSGSATFSSLPSSSSHRFIKFFFGASSFLWQGKLLSFTGFSLISSWIISIWNVFYVILFPSSTWRESSICQCKM